MLDSLPIFVSMGDPGGIGAEIALKAWQQRHAHSLPPFLLHHDLDYLTALIKNFGWNIPLAPIAHPSQALAHFASALPVLPIPAQVPLALGRAQPELAGIIATSIKTGVDFCQSQQVAALVTNPTHKSSMLQGGFAHAGHTEYLGALCGQKPIMLLANDHIRVVPFTGHLPLADVSTRMTIPALQEFLRRLHSVIQRQLLIPQPRIALCGLNPHAGEDGALGTEEQRVIIPALAALHAEGIDIQGPLSADTAFYPEARKNYDVIIGMYHDQVLIPVKTIDFWRSVNITLGLGIVRTSPDHGTAFDIAAQGIARPDSMIAAIQAAAKLQA
jgi:4-hydroxythreonine-4-phosphate dehydrogenase